VTCVKQVVYTPWVTTQFFFFNFKRTTCFGPKGQHWTYQH